MGQSVIDKSITLYSEEPGLRNSGADERQHPEHSFGIFERIMRQEHFILKEPRIKAGREFGRLRMQTCRQIDLWDFTFRLCIPRIWG